MVVKDIVGLLTAFVVLAGITVAITNGGQTAGLITAAGSSFNGMVKAATLQK